MKKYLQFIKESFITSYGKKYNNIKEWAYDYAKEHHDGFNNYEDAIEELNYIFDEIDNLPEYVNLYRILQVNKKSDIDRKNLGRHFILDKKLFYDEGFLNSIGFSKGDIEGNNFYIITININKNDIDFENTIACRLDHPREYEYTISNTNYKINKIEKFKVNEPI